MNTFSKRVEGKLPAMEASVKILDSSLPFYLNHLIPDSEIQREQVSNLKDVLAIMLATLRPVKKNVADFRDSTISIRDQNVSRELNKAADRPV